MLFGIIALTLWKVGNHGGDCRDIENRRMIKLKWKTSVRLQLVKEEKKYNCDMYFDITTWFWLLQNVGWWCGNDDEYWK